LRQFESAVCEGDRKGCWVYFDKIVPKEEEIPNPAAKKPIAPPKGKGPAVGVEELKP
jgi:hypothetical protein